MSIFEWQGYCVTAWGPHWFANDQLVRQGLDYALEQGSNFIAIDWAINFNEDGSRGLNVSSPPLDDIAFVIAEAKARGLTVFLKPHATQKNGPANLNYWNVDSQVFSNTKFLQDWTAYLLELADFAEDNFVDGIFIGTETNMVDVSNRTEWSQLITLVREKFSGQLSYDALFSNFQGNRDIEEVVFWDLLDFIAVSLYVPLTSSLEFTREDLLDYWHSNTLGNIPDIVDYLQDISTRYGKPIFFGEAGFQSFTGSLLDVNSSPSNDKTIDNLSQYLGIDSLLDNWTKNKGDWVKGLSLWQITPHLMTETDLNTIYHTMEFSTYLKPSSDLVRRWFHGELDYTGSSFLGECLSDRIVASFADDILKGGRGNDTLLGAEGDDIFYGDGLSASSSANFKFYFLADNLQNIGAIVQIKLNGLTVIETEIDAPRGGPSFDVIEVQLPLTTIVSSLEIHFTNDVYIGPDMNRNLFLRKAYINETSLSRDESIYFSNWSSPEEGAWDMWGEGYIAFRADYINEILSSSRTESSQDDDTYDGGDGTDAVIYSEYAAKFSTHLDRDLLHIAGHSQIHGKDALSLIENVQFSDLTLETAWFTKTDALTSAQSDSLVELYIASFNRAPDAIGLNYWGGRLYDGMTLPEIARSFFVQPETVAAYPSSMPTQTFVTTVYNNVLSRAPDTAGLNYWAREIDTGSISRDVFLLAIINGAKASSGSATDRQTLANKVSVGNHFAFDEGLNNTTWGIDVMDSVTHLASTVTAANALTDRYSDAIVTGASSLAMPMNLVGIDANEPVPSLM